MSGWVEGFAEAWRGFAEAEVLPVRSSARTACIDVQWSESDPVLGQDPGRYAPDALLDCRMCVISAKPPVLDIDS